MPIGSISKFEVTEVVQPLHAFGTLLKPWMGGVGTSEGLELKGKTSPRTLKSPAWRWIKVADHVKVGTRNLEAPRSRFKLCSDTWLTSASSTGGRNGAISSVTSSPHFLHLLSQTITLFNPSNKCNNGSVSYVTVVSSVESISLSHRSILHPEPTGRPSREQINQHHIIRPHDGFTVPKTASAAIGRLSQKFDKSAPHWFRPYPVP